MKTTKLLLSGVVAMMVAAGALASHNGVIHGSPQSAPRPKPFVVHSPLSPTRPR
jgi:hypothetical protein